MGELEKEGQNIRKAYQRRLPRDMSRDYYFMQRNTGDTESVTVEYGFLDSKGDDVNQLKNNYMNFAEGVVRAVTTYAGIPYSVDMVDDNNGNNTYTVVSGDSLWSISKKFNVTVDDLKRVNNLTSNLLSVGQLLIIPTSLELDVIEYEVKGGDTLYKIAQNFNVNISDIMKYNNLTSNLLSIGQKLIIPLGNYKNDNINQYTVKKGDTLYSIANKFNVSVSDLLKKNNLSSSNLSIGQILYI